MLIRVEVMPWLSELLNASVARKAEMEESLEDGVTLRELLRQLCERHNGFGRMVFDRANDRLTGHAEVAVNGLLSDLAGGLDDPLHEGDIVTFIPGISGGSDERGELITHHWYFRGIYSRNESPHDSSELG